MQFNFGIYYNEEEDEYYCADCYTMHPDAENDEIFKGISDFNFSDIQKTMNDDDKFFCVGCNKVLIDLD